MRETDDATASDPARALRTSEQRRERAEAALAFLSDVSDVLARADDEQAIFDEIASLTARSIGDWCAVYVRDPDGDVRLAALAHPDAARLARGWDAARRYPVRRDDNIVQLIEAGRASLVPHIPPEQIRASARDDRHFEMTRDLDIASAVVAPLIIRREGTGALLMLRGTDSTPYDESDLKLAQLLAKRVALAYENMRQRRVQQRIVDSFQRAALPTALPSFDGLRLDAVYIAASDELSVGGDWYDAFPLPDGRLAMTVGDVAGKGIDAAVMMSAVRQSIRVAALQGLEPSAILAATDAALRMEHRERLVTAFVGVLDPRSWTLAYASAGHPPGLVRRPDGTLLALEGAGLPLGVTSDDARRTRTVIGIPAGSLIVLYTDGLIEATRDVIEGETRLREALAHDAVLHAASPANLIRELVLHGDSRDDVAILTLTLGRETHWSFESNDAVAAQSVRASFVAALARDASADSDIGAAELIFGELVGNVVRYAPGPIDIDLEWTGEGPVLHVLDRGNGFDLRSTLPDDVMSERGRGLFIVAALGRDMRADRLSGRGNHVRVALPVKRRHA